MTAKPDDAYADAAGQDALARQRDEASSRYACCGEPKADGHHPLCRNHVEPEQPPHIEGQESLI